MCKATAGMMLLHCTPVWGKADSKAPQQTSIDGDEAQADNICIAYRGIDE